MSKLTEFKKSYAELHGWFNDESQAVWDSLLSYQAKRKISGDMLEIGVWCGKSAALSALHGQAGETCCYVDPAFKPGVMDTLSSIPHAKAEFIEGVSDQLNDPEFLTGRVQKYRWIHIDGEHTGMALYNDLHIADKLLHRGGIISLDDFLSPSYPQLSMTAFRYIQENPGSLTLVLCGFNKGYLCRPIFAANYRNYIYHSLLNDLDERGAGEFTLWQTSVPEDSISFGITEYDGQSRYYGPDWVRTQVYL